MTYQGGDGWGQKREENAEFGSTDSPYQEMTIDVLSCHKRNLHNVKNKRYNMNHNSKRIKRFSFNMISSLFYLLIVLYHPTFLNLYLYSNPKKIETVKMKQNEICPLDSILSFYYCNVGFVNLVKVE